MTFSSGYDILKVFAETGILVRMRLWRNFDESPSLVISPLYMRFVNIFYMNIGFTFTSYVEFNFVDFIPRIFAAGRS